MGCLRGIQLLAFWGLVSCGGVDSNERVTVFAASSLTEAFEELAREFENTPDGVPIALSFAGSQVLRIQIEQGAPADVFASADSQHLSALQAGGWTAESRGFIRNQLVLAIPEDNPADLAMFSDLPKSRRLILGTETVPIGRYAREAIHRADTVLGKGFERDVLDRVTSTETNARLIRTKLLLGEADAALLYRSDVAATPGLVAIEVPSAFQPTIVYAVATLGDNNTRAENWVDFVIGDTAAAIFARHGFEAQP